MYGVKRNDPREWRKVAFGEREGRCGKRSADQKNAGVSEN